MRFTFKVKKAREIAAYNGSPETGGLRREDYFTVLLLAAALVVAVLLAWALY